MIGIIDYGMGNLRSVQKAFEALGYEAVISSNAEELNKCKGLVLPGVGAFPDAMENLQNSGLDILVRSFAKEDRPILGVCLGMQLLFEMSYEVRECKGLGLIEGTIVKLPKEVKIPHMGWNDLSLSEPCSILKDVNNGDFVYFVHSYFAEGLKDRALNAYTNYGIEVPAVVSKGNVYGTQFHPEKSGSVGMKILRNFGELIKYADKEDNSLS